MKAPIMSMWRDYGTPFDDIDCLYRGLRQESVREHHVDKCTRYTTTPKPKSRRILRKVVESHGHSDVVVDGEGVGVGTNATRLKASLYSSKQHPKGGFVVELEFTIRLPSRQEITEFVAGTGKTEEEAINDAKLNFMLTTFHVVYKAFINASDPHLDVTPVQFSGVNRDVVIGDILLRGPAAKEKIDLFPVRREIKDALKNLRLTDSTHWMKVVYSQKDGEPITVAATLDNQDQMEFTETVKRLHWPRSNFYMAKMFIVIK